MSAAARRTPQEIRAELGYPVIDVDGHILEFMPAALPYVRESLGQELFDVPDGALPDPELLDLDALISRAGAGGSKS